MRGRGGKRAIETDSKLSYYRSARLLEIFWPAGVFPALAPEKVELMKIGDRQITFLETDETMNMLESIDPTEGTGLRDRAMLELLFSTGLRVSELTSLEYIKINLERGEWRFWARGKRNELSLFPTMPPTGLSKYFLARGEAAGPLFRNPKTGKRLSVRTVEARGAQICPEGGNC